ncbi:MAG: hypothetical protein ACTSUT_10615 [Promethearchaeota archaeon]
MDLYDYYKSLTTKERVLLRNEIVAKCEKSMFTFYGWLRRKKVPKYEQTIISEILGVEISELFPKP